MTQPAICHIPAIVDFLGYNPEPEPNTPHERLAHNRRQLGMTQEQFAELLGIDPSTLWRWERGDVNPPAEKLSIVGKALKDRGRSIR